MSKKKDKKLPSEDPNQAAKRVLDFVIGKTENKRRVPTEEVQEDAKLAAYHMAHGGIVITPEGGWRVPTKEEAVEIRKTAQQIGLISP